MIHRPCSRRPGRAPGIVRCLGVLLLLGAVCCCEAAEGPADPGSPALTVYVGKGCPHCARALEWLETLRSAQPSHRIVVHDVVTERAPRQRLAEIHRSLGGGVTVPTFAFRDGRVVVGFDGPGTTGMELAALLAAQSTAPAPGADAPGVPVAAVGSGTLDLPLFGAIDVATMGLPLFTIAIGLVDGFNPCAMWVLLFLLSFLLHVRDRRRMIIIGGVFVLVSGLVYYAFMAAWLGAFLLLGMARWIQVGLGSVALVMGFLNLKDAAWFGHGPSLGIPEAAKPTIYARVRRILAAENMGAALGTVIVLALLVNTVELLCTAGLPALYARILTLRDLPFWAYHGYLLLYNVCYMLDDALILTVAVITLSQGRMQQRQARLLKGLAGGVMALLGIVLIVQPQWLAG